MKGVVIRTNGQIDVQDFDAPLHETLHKAVNGYIEIVHPIGLPHPLCMIVNDEGLLRGLPQNWIGSILYGYLQHGQPIVGDVVIMKEGFTPEGLDIVGLEEKEIKAVLAAILPCDTTATVQTKGENT